MTDLNTLARQLVEHPRCRPCVGLPFDGVHGRFLLGHLSARAPRRRQWFQVGGTPLRNGSRPDDSPLTLDIEDPLTKGWLLHMLREATGTHDACASWLGGEWRLYGWIGASALGRFPTEGAALAAALLAVWNGGAS